MYSIPTEFAERLHNEFDGRLRVRWSYAEEAYSIEQKIARGLADAFPVTDNKDNLIRLRDGYMQIMSVRKGDRMPCPTCGLTLKVPIYETRLIECSYCKAHNNVYQYVAGYFELNDRLIDYLKSIDPALGRGRTRAKEVDFNNARMQAVQEADALNDLHSAGLQDFNQIAGIQSVGYTGKERYQ